MPRLNRGWNNDVSVYDFALCRRQAKLFEFCQYNGYQAEEFVTTYMTWELIRDIDDDLSPVQFWGDAQMFLAVDKTFNLSKNNEPSVSFETMNWIGYITRYWNLWLGTSSKEIITKVPFKKLCEYEMFHTLGNQEAVQRILRHSKLQIQGCYLVGI